MMNKEEFLHLKSGTDVRGTAVETAEHGVQLTDETVQKICVGFYKWYCRKEQVDTFGIAVGQDCRISSPPHCSGGYDGLLCLRVQGV